MIVHWTTTGAADRQVGSATFVVELKDTDTSGYKESAIASLQYLRGIASPVSAVTVGEIFSCKRREDGAQYLKLEIILPVKMLYSRLPQLSLSGKQRFGKYDVEVSCVVPSLPQDKPMHFRNFCAVNSREASSFSRQF